MCCKAFINITCISNFPQEKKYLLSEIYLSKLCGNWLQNFLILQNQENKNSKLTNWINWSGEVHKFPELLNDSPNERIKDSKIKWSCNGEGNPITEMESNWVTILFLPFFLQILQTFFLLTLLYCVTNNKAKLLAPSQSLWKEE